VISEYVEVAHAFYEGDQPGFVNGVLDKLARSLAIPKL
jgi:N utilization substance protein B